MAPVLLADVGGSNARFAVAEPGGRPQHIEAVGDDAVADLSEALARYLDRQSPRPQAAVLAIAGPVDEANAERGEVALTNRAWRFSLDGLARQLRLDRVRAVNDFAAIAWALPLLAADDMRAIGPALPERAGVKVVLGPGTGLGVAALATLDGHTHVLASEAGHVSFGPQTEEEFEVFAALGVNGPVTAESVLSGGGLVRLHHALDEEAGRETAENIVANALADEPTALATAYLFVRLLGRFAGDVALTFKATGGVYIAGGVGRGLGALLDEPQFRDAFEAHPPYQELLAKIPTRLITYAEPGLLGCSALAQKVFAG